MKIESFRKNRSFRKLSNWNFNKSDFTENAKDILRFQNNREAFVRLWLTEGLPFIFREYPDIYEDLREWLGKRLDICPKDITLLGSARLGFSLKPSDFGRNFGDSSDLDFALVSSSLFGKFECSFYQWEKDYTSGSITPINVEEKGYWDGNIEFGHRNLPRGFYDNNKLPGNGRYPIVGHVNNSLWIMDKKLEKSSGIPKFSKSSLMVS